MNATAPDIRGVIVPLTTPIDKNDKIDLKTLERHINYLIETGVKTIIANAGTGDYNSLNESERKQIAETAVDIVDGRINVLVGTSACSTRTAIQWSKHAESIGAKGVMVSPPYYDVKSNIDIVSRHFANISDAISIPILIYNHDGTIQGLLNVEEVEKICKIANTPWIKLTTDNGSSFYHIAKTIPVPADSSLVMDKPVNLEPTDKIHATASANGDLEIYMAILEIT